MVQLIGKSLKVFLFGIIPLFMVSSGPKLDNVIVDCGTYEFIVSGKYNQRITGLATFSSKLEEDTFGNLINSLELNFESNDNGNIKTIEFIIANALDYNDIVTTGSYEIEQLDRLINEFNGVYGVVDIGGSDELPFFSNEGSIVIVESFANSVLGNIEVQLKNAGNESLSIKGTFNAN
jgi:hypothetical protein